MGEAYILRRGGSGDTKFHLIAVTNVNELPSFAIKNTFAIISNIPAGKFYIQGEVPANPNIGDVYVGGSKNLAFIVQENSTTDAKITVEYAEQYDGEKWNRVEGYSWLDNEWKLVCVARLPLYYRGDQKITTSGGWDTDINKGMKGEFKNDSYVFTITDTGDRYGTIYTKNKINLENYKTLNMIVSYAKGVGSSGNIYLGAVASNIYTGGTGSELLASFSAGSATNVAPDKGNTISSETTITVDVTSLDGSYYIQLGTAIAALTVVEVYLE